MTIERLKEIIAYARENGIDPVDAAQDYFDEKDSHFSRRQVAEIIARLEKSA